MGSIVSVLFMDQERKYFNGKFQFLSLILKRRH